MTLPQIKNIIKKYLDTLSAHIAEDEATCHLCHCKWMITEMLSWDHSKLDKAFRWLGFIQGVLFNECIYSLEELKEHNR